MRLFETRSFLLAFFSIIVFGIIAVLGANIIVDPFYRFNLVTIPGVNIQRYQFSSNVRMGKAGAVCRVNPDVVIFGSSRAEIGLNPHHPGFRNEQVYNFGLAGAGMKELSDTIRHTVYAAPHFHRAIIALDFFLFNAFREEVLFNTEVLDFDPNRLLKKPDNTCLQNFLYDADRLIGFQGLRYVLETLRSQRPESEKNSLEKISQANWWLALYDADGFRGHSYDVLELLASNTGMKIFHKDDGFGQETYYIKKIWRVGPGHRYSFAKNGQPNTLDVFRDMLRFVREAHLNIQFVINPIHARMLLAIQEAGLWQQYEDWKRSLVKIIEENAAEYHLPPYLLWDFSGFNSITMEEVPYAQGRIISKWFWEPSHYRKATGDLILNKILDVKGANKNSQPKDFGMLLNSTNIESWISKNLILRSQYIATHQEEVKKLRMEIALQLNNWVGVNYGDDVQALREGALALKNGDLSGAKIEFNRASTIHELYRQRIAKLSLPYHDNGFEYLMAEAIAGKPIDQPLESWQAYQERGNARIAHNDYQGAIADYDAALKDSPPNPALYFLRGTAKMKFQDFKGAAQDFADGLKIDPNNAALKALLAEANQKKSVA